MDPFNRVGSDSHTGSTPSSGSTRKKKKKKNVSTYEKDEGHPPKDYTQFIREVTIAYYRIHRRDILKRSYLDQGHAGILLLQADLECEFWNKFSQSEKFID